MKSSKRIQNLKTLHSTALSERKRDFEMPEMQMPGGPALLSGAGNHPSLATTAPPRPSSPRRKPVNMVDLNLNDDPPESDGEDGMLLPPTPVDPSTRSNVDESPSVKSTVSVKDPDLVENEEIDQQCHGASMSREEKVCSLKAGLVHVARKVPKNAHAHYILGLMYQRLGQPQKAILAYEKSAEILLQDEDDVRRPDLLAMVRIHHSQCILQATTGDSLDKELDARELGEILAKLDTSMQADVKQASVWNTLGAILLKMGQLKSAISVFSSILSFSPDHLDSMANLGVAFLQSGKLELALQCFQDLVLRDQNHPAALLNYATCLLYKLGSVTAETGPGAFAGEGTHSDQVEGINVAKECLLAAVKAEPKSAQLWVNLANACYLAGEHTNAKSCLEQAAKLEPNQMAVRYAIATHRIREAERAQESTDQLVWAANEMATLIKEGDPALIDIPTAWSGFAMAHKAQHEIGATYESKQMDLDDIEERAVCTLKQTINEDSDDAVHWHQLGLHNLRTMQFKPSVKFFKSSLVRSLDCSYTWSNLGVAFHLSHDAPSAETVYKRALSLSKNNQTHAILSNLGNLYREQRKLELAKRILSKSLELTPGYAPANNNLGLVCVAQGQWEEAIGYFKKALESDPLLDCAQSNLAKAVALSTSHGTTGN